MTVDMLDTGTILVTLGENDMRTYTLDFSNGADLSRMKNGLSVLLYRVGDICGLDASGKSWLIEALPSGGGCLLIITVRPVRRRKIYRVKRGKTRPMCVFDDVDAMLDYIGRASDKLSGFTIYDHRGSYVILPEPYTSAAALAELSEYGKLLNVSPVDEAGVREFGKVVMQKKAHRRYPSSAAI